MTLHGYTSSKLTSSLLSFFKILTPHMLKHPNYFHFRQVSIDKKAIIPLLTITQIFVLILQHQKPLFLKNLAKISALKRLICKCLVFCAGSSILLPDCIHNDYQTHHRLENIALRGLHVIQLRYFIAHYAASHCKGRVC